MTNQIPPSTLYEIGKSFAEFKDANNERLAQIERKGHADPLTEAKVNRLNEDISRLQEAAQKSNALLETIKNRSPLGGTQADVMAEAQLFSLERKSHLRDDLELGAYNQYKAALKAYIRKNNSGASGLEEVKALSVGSDPDGGFAVTPDMSGQIVSLIRGSSPMRQIANVVTIGSDALEGINDLNEATSGWVGETEARTETDTPKIGEWRIPVFEQYAEPRATQKLLDDALFDVEGYLAGKIAERLARMENTAFITGNGVKKPRGILTYAAGTPSASNFSVIEQIASGGDGGFDDENPGDPLINLVYSLKSAYRENACFLMNRSTAAAVRKLKDGNDNYLWQPDFQNKQSGTLLGFDVVEAEDMPDIASGSLSIAFGDFKAGYQIVDRQGIRILRDSFTAKPYVKFYTTKRVGGDVVNFDAIKLMKFSTT